MDLFQPLWFRNETLDKFTFAEFGASLQKLCKLHRKSIFDRLTYRIIALCEKLNSLVLSIVVKESEISKHELQDIALSWCF